MARIQLLCVTNQESLDLVVASVVTVGRGFFACQDKRVSRNHGTITVAEATISVKSCHTNPIFYKLSDQQATKILSKDSEVTLKHKDRFSLLPTEFEYEVRVIEQTEEAMADDESSANADSTSAGPSAGTRKRSHGDGHQTIDSKRKKPEDESVGSSSADSSAVSTIPMYIKPDPDQIPNEPSSSTPAVVGTIQVKAEPMSQPSDDSPATDSAGVSSSNAAPTAPDVKFKTEPAQPPSVVAPLVPAQPSIRPSCNHGIRCYLNTPEHRQQHAHPNDADYRRPVYPDPPPDTPPCPFGASCYRRNPDHFGRLSHPPAAQYVAHQNPPVVRQNVARPPMNVIIMPFGDNEDDDDEDDYGDDFDDSLEDEEYELVDAEESDESGIDEADQESDDPDNCEE